LPFSISILVDTGQIVVNSMNDRKTEMAKRVDGFFGLPGGFGTLDEVRFAPFIQFGLPIIFMDHRSSR
jgi:hypothetical protein